MNFLRNFLQGKETSSKTGVQSAREISNTSLPEVKVDIYPLSRSATDPSNCASSEKSSEQVNFKSSSESKQVNISSSCQINNSSDIGVTVESHSSSVPHTEKKFKERPSFKIENHLRQHSDQVTVDKASLSQEDFGLGLDGQSISPTPNLDELKPHDINFNEKVTTSKEPSAHNIELPCDITSCEENLKNKLSHTNETSLKVDKQTEEDSNYLEFGFEEPKKNRKPPARLLGKKPQSNQKKGSKAKQQQTNKKKIQNGENFSNNKELKELPNSKEIVKESLALQNSLLPTNSENNKEHFVFEPVINSGENIIETKGAAGCKELATTEGSNVDVNEDIPSLVKEDIPILEKDIPILEKDIPILVKEDIPILVKEDIHILTKDDIPILVKENISILVNEDISTLGKEDIPILVEEDIPNLIKEDIPNLVKEDLPNLIKEDIPNLVKEDLPNLVKEDLPNLIKEDIPNLVKEDLPNLVKEDLPNLIKEDIPNLVKEDVPNLIKKDNSNLVKEDIPILISETLVSNLPAEISQDNNIDVTLVDTSPSQNREKEPTVKQKVTGETIKSTSCELGNAYTSLNLETSDKGTFESNYTVEKPDNNSESLEKENLGFKRPSVISISCYGNEEFERLGNEANKLAEELTHIDKPIEVEFESMTSRSSTDECTNNFGSMSLEIDGKSERMLSKRDSLLLQVGDSEAGPDIATGLTSNDLKCASEFFREAAELESQIRRNIASSVGSYADFGVEADRASCASDSDIYNSNGKAGITSPPREERSAPEGTSSPDPKSLEDSEVRGRLPRSPNGSFSPEVNELLKKQALEFEEKLLRQGIVAAEKEKELHEMLKEEQNHLQKITASRDMLLKLVEQYKGMLGALVSDKEKANKGQEEKMKTLEVEKQQALEDLSNVEAAFSDVHRKYERTKQIVDTLRRNEETLRTAVAEYEQKLLKQERKYVELQKHAEEKVKLANDEFESLRRTNDQEMTKMGALLKKAEMKIISLQENLDRKNRENQELTQLCDDLISKVGS